MKQYYVFFCVLLLFGSCLSEDGATSSQPATFIRYYYGGYNDQAVALEQTSDKGFILLSTVTIPKSETSAAKSKIKLTKTDEFGNPQWTALHPDFAAGNDTTDYRARGIQILANDAGYVVTGEHIKGNGTSQALVLTVGADGKELKKKYIAAASTASLSGQAVTVNSTGNYVVLSSSLIPNISGDTEMLLGEMKKDDLSTLWGRDYSAGTASLVNHLYLDGSDVAFWAGTVTKNNITGIRIVKAAPDAQNSYFDLFHINPPYIEEANDFCPYVFGYATVGSTDQKGAVQGDKDILFKRYADDGSLLISKSYPLDDPARKLVDTQNDIGNSIVATKDNGFILLASAGSLAIGGRGDNDFLLIHINAFGDEVWRSHFGSRFKDTGVAVRQTNDGGFMVLGTTTQGGRDMMVLAKTNSVGQIE